MALWIDDFGMTRKTQEEFLRDEYPEFDLLLHKKEICDLQVAKIGRIIKKHNRLGIMSWSRKVRRLKEMEKKKLTKYTQYHRDCHLMRKLLTDYDE